MHLMSFFISSAAVCIILSFSASKSVNLGASYNSLSIAADGS